MKELELKSHLNLCPVCGGTGNDPSDKKHKCVYCEGCMANNERTILHHMGEMKRILGVKY